MSRKTAHESSCLVVVAMVLGLHHVPVVDRLACCLARARDLDEVSRLGSYGLGCGVRREDEGELVRGGVVPLQYGGGLLWRQQLVLGDEQVVGDFERKLLLFLLCPDSLRFRRHQNAAPEFTINPSIGLEYTLRDPKNLEKRELFKNFEEAKTGPSPDNRGGSASSSPRGIVRFLTYSYEGRGRGLRGWTQPKG